MDGRNKKVKRAQNQVMTDYEALWQPGAMERFLAGLPAKITFDMCELDVKTLSTFFLIQLYFVHHTIPSSEYDEYGWDVAEMKRSLRMEIKRRGLG